MFVGARAVSDHCGAYGFLAVTVREGGQVQKLGQEISIRVIPSMPSSSAYRPVLLKSESTTWPPGLRTRTISRMASRRSSRVGTYESQSEPPRHRSLNRRMASYAYRHRGLRRDRKLPRFLHCAGLPRGNSWTDPSATKHRFPRRDLAAAVLQRQLEAGRGRTLRREPSRRHEGVGGRECCFVADTCQNSCCTA